ncbi:type II toxin-antitoxin system Phd/YefM family antitoxin [Deferrisoma palaeochoriense]
MKVYTYTEARQNLARILEEAQSAGKVLIQRRDGSVFALMPEPTGRSPLDVDGIEADVTSEDLVRIIREGRERAASVGEPKE